MVFKLVAKGTGAGKSPIRFKVMDKKNNVWATIQVRTTEKGRKLVKWHPWKPYRRQEIVNFLCAEFRVDQIYNY